MPGCGVGGPCDFDLPENGAQGAIVVAFFAVANAGGLVLGVVRRGVGRGRRVDLEGRPDITAAALVDVVLWSRRRSISRPRSWSWSSIWSSLRLAASSEVNQVCNCRKAKWEREKLTVGPEVVESVWGSGKVAATMSKLLGDMDG